MALLMQSAPMLVSKQFQSAVGAWAAVGCVLPRWRLRGPDSGCGALPGFRSAPDAAARGAVPAGK